MPERRRSVYEGRYSPEVRESEPVIVAEANPVTGELEWVPDWPRVVGGCTPLDEFLRR